MEFPADIVCEILLKLPAKSLLRLRCVSKMWCNIIDSVSFATIHHSSSSSAADILPVTLQAAIKKLHSIAYDDDIMRISKNPILDFSEEAKDYVVCHVAYGLICLQNLHHAREAFLYNPLRRELLRLPTISTAGWSYVRMTWCGMGFDSTTNAYKIVRVLLVGRSFELATEVYTLGTDSWREVSSVPSCCLSKTGVSAYGDMHWSVNDFLCYKNSFRSIVTFDFKREEFKRTCTPNFGDETRLALILINLRGCLAVVSFPSSIDMEIWVLNDYNKKERECWVRECIISTLEVCVREPSTRNNLCLWENFSFSACASDHGLFFGTHRHKYMYFLDLRTKLLWYKQCPFQEHEEEGKRSDRVLFNYTGNVLSLRNFGNVLYLGNSGNSAAEVHQRYILKTADSLFCWSYP